MLSVLDNSMYMLMHTWSMARHPPPPQELARCEVLERADKLKHNQQVYKQQRARKAKLNYNKDYGMCRDMLLLMVDMASKLAQYRELTKGSVNLTKGSVNAEQTTQQKMFCTVDITLDCVGIIDFILLYRYLAT